MPAEHEAMDWRGRRVELRVGKVAQGGHCVARVDGRVVFVRHALPDELALVEVTEDRGGSFCLAEAVAIREASPDRVAPPCPVSGPGGCGGCDFQHVALAAQRAMKSEVIAEQLDRLAGVHWPVEVEPLDEDGLRWRTRARLAVDDDGLPGFRAHHSHAVIPVDDCPITVRAALEGVVDRRFTPGGEVETVIDDVGAVHVQEIPPARSGRRGRPRAVTGDEVATQRVDGRQWQVDVRGFWQPHTAAARVLARVVGEFAQAPEGGAAWDLYGGAGLFASVLAQQVGPGGSVLVVEASQDAVVHGRASLADLGQVTFRNARSEAALARGVEPRRPDVVVLDPPRKGAARGVVPALAKADPARVVYVACDPAPFARDVASLAKHGYRLRNLRAFDTFPMTRHVECVGLFTRD